LPPKSKKYVKYKKIFLPSDRYYLDPSTGLVVFSQEEASERGEMQD
jgi:hypothetical protein